MEDPRLSQGTSAVATPAPGRLKSLEQFMTDRKVSHKDDWSFEAYEEYWKLLVAAWNASAKDSVVKSHIVGAKDLLKKGCLVGALNQHLNSAYQALAGPRPGDDLRKIIATFVVDDHQVKHYKNGDSKWGLFSGKWDEVHKIIQYGSRLILEQWANLIDNGATPTDQVLDGYVQFDQNVGTPGDQVKKEVSLIKIQISRTSKATSGHGYPVPGIDNKAFPEVKGSYATALIEVLTSENNSVRSKT